MSPLQACSTAYIRTTYVHYSTKDIPSLPNPQICVDSTQICVDSTQICVESTQICVESTQICGFGKEGMSLVL